METTLFALLAFTALITIFGALATLYGEESREGFAPYAADA